MTYALLQLGRALTVPVRLSKAADAVTAAQARARIYRTAARITSVCRATLSGGPPAGLTRPEHAVLDHLIVELNRTVKATAAVLNLPAAGPVEPTARHLADAAASAGLAWDLLATRLPPDGQSALPAQAWAAGMETRAVLADGLLLVRGMTSLDAALGAQIAATATSDPAADAADSLRAVAEDCQMVAMPDVSASAAAMLQMAIPLQAGTWARVDQMAAAPAPARRGQQPTPADVVAATDAYLAWLVRRSGDLTVADLNDLASIGARLVRLANPAGENPAACHAVQAWRQVHNSLSTLRSVHPRPEGYGRAAVLAECVDRPMRRAASGGPVDADWPAAADDMVQRLPELADAGRSSLRRLDVDLKILGRQTNPSMPPELTGAGTANPLFGLYRPADDRLVDTAADAFSTAGQASAVLTRRRTPTSTASGSMARPAMLARVAFPTPLTVADHTTAEPGRSRSAPARRRGRTR